jgi:N-acetylglucosaminyldiphosphoundecaprenol N-acetyl-beta-D-mannosaminyltransferase
MVDMRSQAVMGPLGLRFMVGNHLDAMSYLYNSFDSTQAAVDVHLVNAYTIALASKDESLLEVLKSPTSLNLVDSFWLAKVLSLSTNMNVPQCPGPKLFQNCLESDQVGVRQFLLGGSEDNLKKIHLRAESAAVRTDNIVGSYAPKHQPLEKMDVEVFSQAVRSSTANLVWVGLGTPKQDFIASRLTRLTEVNTVCVGAAFDFYAGTQKQAPLFLRQIGMEWFFRLVTEPRRLWKRYLVGNMIFIRESCKFLLRG